MMLIGAFATALRCTLLPRSVSGISAKEVANYVTERFTHEPDLGGFRSGRFVGSWYRSTGPLDRETGLLAR
jgi:hypothetical protein